MSQQFRYPNSAVVNAEINSEGVPGDPIPSQAMLIGGEDSSGDLRSAAVDSDGHLQVDILTLPAGLATSANQLLEIGELQDIEAAVGVVSSQLPAGVGQTDMANSFPVTIASDQSALPISAGSLPLPTGAATEATLSAINTKTPALGQAAMAGSVPVVIASNQSPLLLAALEPTGLGTFDTAALSNQTAGTDGFGNQINALAVYDYAQGTSQSLNEEFTSGSGDAFFDAAPGTDTAMISVDGTWTGSISGTIDLNGQSSPVQFRAIGTGTVSTSITANGIYLIEGTNLGYVTIVNSVATGTAFVVVAASVFLKNSSVWARQAGTWTTAATQSGTWNINNISGSISLPSGAATESTSQAIQNRLPSALGQAIMANSLAVTIASNQSEIPAVESPAASSSVTSVASSATNVTLLAANSSRKFATFFNDSTQVLYLKFGATASSSSYTVQIPGGGYYEIPYRYTGIIDGIWASANGNARITELS